MTATEIRTLCLASLGGALEFYDFVVFVFFAVAIGQLFFPPSLPEWLRQVQTFGLFAAGYLARPLGGVVIAHFGDTRGRKRMFTLSVLLMAVPTLLIGLLPTWHTIGPLAPLLLLALRVMQGAAIGGEAPGGWVFVAEHARDGRRGRAIGLLTAGLTGGILLGSLMATVMNAWLPPARILAGWWRLPFLLGGVAGLGAMALRRWLDETPVFRELRARAVVGQAVPARVVMARHRPAVLASMASTWTLTASIVVLILMTPVLLQRQFGIAPRVALSAGLVGTITLCVSAFCVGLATDRFGLRRTAMVSLALLSGSAWLLYLGAAHRPGLLVVWYALAGLGAGAVTLTPVLMIQAFPPAVRFSGLSLSYNVAYAMFGGTTPLLVAWLAHLDRLAPAAYVSATAVIGLVACWCAPRPPAGGVAEPASAGDVSLR